VPFLGAQFDDALVNGPFGTRSQVIRGWPEDAWAGLELAPAVNKSAWWCGSTLLRTV